MSLPPAVRVDDGGTDERFVLVFLRGAVIRPAVHHLAAVRRVSIEIGLDSGLRFGLRLSHHHQGIINPQPPTSRKTSSRTRIHLHTKLRPSPRRRNLKRIHNTPPRIKWRRHKIPRSMVSGGRPETHN